MASQKHNSLASVLTMLLKQPPFALPTHLLFFILLLYSFVFSCQQVCNPQDQSALLAFSSNISTSPPLPLNWSSSISCCIWEGVECDMNGRVTHLQLNSRGLDGVITSSISRLVMLTHLNLSNNYLHGPLGEEIYSLTNLIILDLSSNSIAGSIHHKVGKLLSLQKLHLYENSLSGRFPSSLMNCTNLVEILMRDNHLDGDFSKLDFSRLVRLQKLDLRNNSLNGTIPESIYSCKSLIALGVGRNNISGQISPKTVELKSLSFISLAENSFTNITSTLRILANCKNLTTLFLSSNFYNESLPVHRNFIGLGEFAKLRFFFLEDCMFTPGPIPNWLSNLKRLKILSLQGNRMAGRVPNWLGTLPSLSLLQLNNNSLVGELPLELCQLPALISAQNFQAGMKFFQFEIPVFYVVNVTARIRFKDTFYHGLDLSYNALSGDIPKEIGNLLNLQELFLNNNSFSGHIPSSISNLKILERLNFSANNLNGEIPTSLVSLTFMSQFDVFDNDLKGPIPTGGQFGTFPESSFKGNPGLCGAPLNHFCSNPATSMDRNGSRDPDHNMHWFLNGLCVGFAVGFSGILVVIASYSWSTKRKKCWPASLRRG